MENLIFDEMIPFFSIIVPVYNVAPYLEQCVNSILSQTFKDFELFLIDDKSPDDSGEICNRLAKTDSRVTVVHKEKNEGLGAARNTGISKATGRYIWFIDSDDFLIDDTAFQIVAYTVKTQKPDVVLYSYKKFFEESGRFSRRVFCNNQKVRSGELCAANHVQGSLEQSGQAYTVNSDKGALLQANTYKVLACNKVVNFDLIKRNDMKFPVGVVGEDLPWCADLLVYAKKIAIVNKDLLAYRQSKRSISGNQDISFRKRHIQDALNLITECVNKYGVGKDSEEQSLLVGHLLAYEYSCLLGAVHPFYREFRSAIERVSFLLEYDLNLKAAKVKKLCHAIGMRNASCLLSVFIKLKNFLRLTF
jgi:glycosyltransferase involved in cell wall biosynthesis